jgi:hypothetical protein
MCSPQAMFGNQWTDRDLRIAASRRLATVGEPRLRCLLNVRVAPRHPPRDGFRHNQHHRRCRRYTRPDRTKTIGNIETNGRADQYQ